MGTAVAIFACNNPFDAIKVANTFAHARGGRVATVPDLFRLFREQPDHRLFEHFILTDSVLMVGCERRNRGKYPRTHLVHGAGFLTNPNLRAWYGEDQKSQSVHEAARNRGLRLSHEMWRDYRDLPTALKIRSRTDNWWPGPHLLASVRDSLDTQQRSLMGEGYREFIESRRRILPKPQEDVTDKTRSGYHAWRRGGVHGFEFLDGRLRSQEFRRGDFALASPLQFAVQNSEGMRENIILYSWESMVTCVLALSADWAPSDPIFIEESLELKQWMVGREDCFHSSESIPPHPSRPFFLEPCQGRPGWYLAYADPDDREICPPLGMVEVERILGEVVVPEPLHGDALTADEMDALKPTMPVGTQALLVCSERVTTEEVDIDMIGSDRYIRYKSLPVQFVRVRPCHEGRYLTHDELFANPTEYLRRIGVGI